MGKGNTGAWRCGGPGRRLVCLEGVRGADNDVRDVARGQMMWHPGRPGKHFGF